MRRKADEGRLRYFITRPLGAPLLMKKYIVVWWRLAQMSFMMQCSTQLGSLGWLGGKCIRLAFFLIFLVAIYKHVPSVAGYSILEVAFFFLTFNVVDIVAQLFFRGIYGVGRDIREGDMDFYLIQPINPLFRISSNLIDFLDFLTLLPVLVLIGFILPKILVNLSLTDAFGRTVLYVSLCANGVVIAFCLHVLIASLTISTQQMENTLWLYRDLVSLGRFPVDIYVESVRAILTFAIPIAVMVSYPSKALLGLLSVNKILFAFLLSGALLFVSISIWQTALRRYCSVSS